MYGPWLKLDSRPWVHATSGHNQALFDALFDLNPDMDLGSEGLVYYVLLDNGRWKIGYTADPDRLKERLTVELPTQYDFLPVQLMAIERGGFAREQFRHYQFADLRLLEHGEQFTPAPELKAFAKQLRENYDSGLTEIVKSLTFQERPVNKGFTDSVPRAELMAPDGIAGLWFLQPSVESRLRKLGSSQVAGYQVTADKLKLFSKKNSLRGEELIRMTIEALEAIGAKQI